MPGVKILWITNQPTKAFWKMRKMVKNKAIIGFAKTLKINQDRMNKPYLSLSLKKKPLGMKRRKKRWNA
jgi:hypothetical protein